MHISAASMYSGLLCLIAAAFWLLSCGEEDGGGNSIPGYVQSELSNASDFQREILVDGEVTPAEYERSVLATLQCLDRNGVVRSEPELRTDGDRTRWYYTYEFSKEEEERVNKIYNECYDQYERSIAVVWGLQTAPSEQDEQELRAKLLACLKEHGLEVSSIDEVPALSEGWTAEEKTIQQNCLLLVYRGEDRFQE